MQGRPALSVPRIGSLLFSRAGSGLGRDSDSASADLPERVRIAIAAHQDRSEIMIGWLQLAVVGTFAALYLVSPKLEDRFDLVPFALAIYFALTLIRLVWAHRTRLPDWSLTISILFDVTLLMTLIWSFHVKYQQPPSFYLKAPTLLYVFIFIALRALRFEARPVLIAGGMAALGWLALLIYALLDPDDAQPITRDYVTYMTSNSVLIGAEIDKIVAILMVTAITGVALARGRRLLVQAVVEQTAASELSRFFAPAVAARIKGADRALRAGVGELRDAAILSLDIRGFTPFAARTESDAVLGLLARYQARMVPLIRKHGGSVDKFLGDGILATFGAASVSDRSAADALRAIDDIMAEAESWSGGPGGFGLRINGAVATGRVLFGVVGDSDRLEYTVIGEAVNLSAKLEKANKQVGANAVCDGPTFALACAQGYRPRPGLRHLNGCRVDGVDSPLDLVILA